MTPKSKTALFAGSFNPFTIGHADIVERALGVCDKLVIGFGSNIDKPTDAEDLNFKSVKRLYAGDNRISVQRYFGLTVDFAKQCGADFMVRGVRNVTDFEYERNLAEVNLKISGIETLFIIASPELTYVSSSMVRELAHYGQDIRRFLPYDIK